MITRLERMHERDGRSDGWTDNARRRLFTASRGKKLILWYYVVRGNVVWLGVYVNGYRIIDQRLLHGDTRVIVEGDVRVADHPFRLTRKPR